MKYKQTQFNRHRKQLTTVVRVRKFHIQLHREIHSRDQLSPAWENILINWINKFQTFTIDLTGTKIHETRLLQQTLALLAKQPKHCSNYELCAVLSTEFEGLYWRAEVGPSTWCSIDEPYLEFKQRLQNTVLDIYVSEEPQVSPQVANAWLVYELNTCPIAPIR